MDRHLVAVEVRVEGRADERVQTNGAALYPHGLECLNAQTVQRWRAVQQDKFLFHNLFKQVPDHRVKSPGSLNEALGRACSWNEIAFQELPHHEGLEEF